MDNIYHHWPFISLKRHVVLKDLVTIGSINGLLPARRQTITWANVNLSPNLTQLEHIPMNLLFQIQIY